MAYEPQHPEHDNPSLDEELGLRKTISILKACELVGVSRRTIYNWIANGKVDYVRTAGGSIRIYVDTLWRQSERNPIRPGN